MHYIPCNQWWKRSNAGIVQKQAWPTACCMFKEIDNSKRAATMPLLLSEGTIVLRNFWSANIVIVLKARSQISFVSTACWLIKIAEVFSDNIPRQNLTKNSFSGTLKAVGRVFIPALASSREQREKRCLSLSNSISFRFSPMFATLLAVFFWSARWLRECSQALQRPCPPLLFFTCQLVCLIQLQPTVLSSLPLDSLQRCI